MSLPSVYEPEKYEPDIYALWERGEVFKAKPGSGKPTFSISMPPPNETGKLHLGHALGITLQDIIARHARQQGYDVLLLPGTDHAALATNAIMERRLAEQGTDKHKIGREEFLRITREFVGNSRNIINAQIRAVGASCDWSRLSYTLDATLSRCVNEVFVKMYNDGLIYKGSRIINWDPVSATTVSDDEVTHQEVQGSFYSLQFGPFQIGTARPETKFGDKYVVMNPDDERYKQYKSGDTFEAEWINGPVKATVIKDNAVDPGFGTGVMTITPWHDHTDYEIAERHGLNKEQIIDFDGKLMPLAGEFAGMPIAEARPKIIDKLRLKGLLVGVDEAYVHNLALNTRGKGLIEPQIKLQWFIDVNRAAVDWKGRQLSLKEVMRTVIREGDIKITPERFEKIYFHWIDNLRDWCISRQIWWGHQVPVWYRGEATHVSTTEPEGQGWERDPDTLDTWFSSSLWTWSTLISQQAAQDYSLSLSELLNASPDFKTYHPTSVMETGWDILFFWVARMVLSTTYATGQIPFKNVYLHGLVRAEDGRKMSKSDPGSMIDPMEIIPRYGADALRLALVSGVSAGQDQRLGRGKIIDNRNFCNKLWNVARYIEMTAGGTKAEANPSSPADHWILNKLSKLSGEQSKNIESFKFYEAYQDIYHFIWDDLADWYIEASKTEPNKAMLNYILDSALVTIHPYAPFITEVIWQKLGHKDLLAGRSQPNLAVADKTKVDNFQEIKDIVAEIRRIKFATSIDKCSLLYLESPAVSLQSELIKKLAGLNNVGQISEPPNYGLKLLDVNAQAWLDIQQGSVEAYSKKLQEKLQATQNSIDHLKNRLANKSYTDKAPRALVEETKSDLESEKVRFLAVKNEIYNLQKSLKG